MGNNHFVMQSIADGRYDKARDYVAWLLGASRGYGIKVVNPGGVENWKWGKNVAELDDEVIGYGVTPRQIVQTLAQIADDLGLPHSVHIHGINLGRHTSARTTVEMIAALDGHRAHLCHLQFLSYGPGRTHVHRSEAAAVAAAVNASPLHHRRRRAARLRQRHDDDVRRPSAARPASDDRPPVGQQRRRVRDRRRHRADHVQGRQSDQRHDVAHRHGALPAHRRPVAGLPQHRPPQRRAVHELSADHQAAHGP